MEENRGNGFLPNHTIKEITLRHILQDIHVTVKYDLWVWYMVYHPLNSHSTYYICFVILHHKERPWDIRNGTEKTLYDSRILLCPSFAGSYQHLTSQIVNTTEGARLLSYLEASFRGQERWVWLPVSAALWRTVQYMLVEQHQRRELAWFCQHLVLCNLTCCYWDMLG
jgi:hypothetical protein